MIKKLILFILLSLCLAFQASALTPMIMTSGNGNSCDTTSIVYWNRFEDTDLNGDCTGDGAPYACCSDLNTGTCDYSTASGTGTLTNAVIGTGAVKYGVNGLDSRTAFERLTMASPTATLDDEGKVGFYLRIVDFQTGGQLFRAFANSNNHFTLNLSGSDDATGRELLAKWYYEAGTEISVASTTADMAENVWYWVEMNWNHTANTMNVWVDGVQVITSTDAMTGLAVAMDYIIYANLSAVTSDFHIDNLMISTDEDQDFTNCKDLTEYP